MKLKKTLTVKRLQTPNKPWKTRFFLILVMLFGFLQPLLLSVSSQASAVQWTGETGWWDEAVNWEEPYGVPRAGDDVFLTPTDEMDREVYYRNTLYPDATLNLLWIGALTPGNVTLSLGQDRLEVDEEYIGAPLFSPGLVGTPFYGASGSGTVTQTGGEHVVNNRLYVGYLGGTGTYNMIGGDLSAAHLEVGSETSDGEINQSGGTVTAGVLTVGGYPYGGGAYNLSRGSLTTDSTYLGEYGYGDFNQSGGTHVTHLLVLGDDGTGNYNLSGGTVEADRVWTGRTGSSRITQTGGTFIVNDSLEVGVDTGYYDLIDGTLEANNVSLVGSYGNAVFTQTGGTHIVHDELLLVFDTSEYNLSGGSLTTNSTSFWFGGEFNQSGGTHVTNTLTIGSDEVSYSKDPHYNLSGGTLTALSLINNGEFNYSGGDLNADITNFGTATLSGDGTRVVNGNVINNGAWESTDTTVNYKGSFANGGTFNSENSIQYFDELSIIESGSMTGSGEAPWFVKEQISGLSILDGTVTNIFGEDGFNLYYNPRAAGNDYLGGGDYDLIDGGTLAALDGIICTDQYFTTDYLILGDTLTFDYWWEMDMEPTEGNFDVLFFNGTEWETFGWELNFDGSSTEWQMATFWVPPWLRGEDVQIMFSLYDWGDVTDPTVYLRNIGSSFAAASAASFAASAAPVPEPSTIILLGTGLLGLIGASRRKLMK